MLFTFHWIVNRHSAAVIGMLPAVLWNQLRLHEHISKVLKQSCGTFELTGPWFSNHNFVFTSDPMNIQHMLSKRFSNYPNGPKFTMTFEPLFGNGIIAADSDMCKFQRKVVHSYLHDTKFLLFFEKTIQDKVIKGLIPVLDHVRVRKMEVNLEDVLLRFGFDISCMLFLGCDPKCLSAGFPEVPCEKALDDMEEALIHRNIVPEKYWRLLKWLQIGHEKKLSKSLKIFDGFMYDCISSKREKYLNSRSEMEESKPGLDFLTSYLMQEETITEGAPLVIKSSNKFLRDMVTNLVVAGRDTSSTALSWFFWLLAMNPTVETKILEEITENLQVENSHIFATNELHKLVYLHAALCETLRLNIRCSVLPDTLPSGLHVNENTNIAISFYAMGNEFKPERWISNDGGIIHVPSYKFTAFGAGPRSCVGKDMSFVQMKIVAAAIIFKYQFQVVVPSTSLVLHMKHGLKVRVTNTSV